jgi:hypothetical protein
MIYIFNFIHVDDARVAKEVEAYEIRMKKELEKQDILRRKVLFNEHNMSLYIDGALKTSYSFLANPSIFISS